jgi:hypothetical protein
MAEPSTLVIATTGHRLAYRDTASRVSADPPLADTATTTVPGRTAGSTSLLASSATASTPRARRRAAATALA